MEVTSRGQFQTCRYFKLLHYDSSSYLLINQAV